MLTWYSLLARCGSYSQANWGFKWQDINVWVIELLWISSGCYEMCISFQRKPHFRIFNIQSKKWWFKQLGLPSIVEPVVHQPVIPPVWEPWCLNLRSSPMAQSLNWESTVPDRWCGTHNNLIFQFFFITAQIKHILYTTLIKLSRVCVFSNWISQIIASV